MLSPSVALFDNRALLALQVRRDEDIWRHRRVGGVRAIVREGTVEYDAGDSDS